MPLQSIRKCIISIDGTLQNGMYVTRAQKTEYETGDKIHLEEVTKFFRVDFYAILS